MVITSVYQRPGTHWQGLKAVPVLIDLHELGFDLIWDNCADPMHILFLGVTKTLFEKHFFAVVPRPPRPPGPGLGGRARPRRPCRPPPIPFGNINKFRAVVSGIFTQIKLPPGFGRKPRKLDHMAKFKGTLINNFTEFYRVVQRRT